MESIKMLPAGAIRFNGMVDNYVNFVENLHLKDRSVWDKFVNVFRVLADNEDYGWRSDSGCHCFRCY